MAVPVLAGACDAVLPGRGASPADSTVAVEPGPKPVRAARSRKSAAGSAVDQGAAFTTIRGALRRLVVVEETYFAENGTYTGDLDRVRFQPPADVTVTILWATRDGWAARARHGGIPSKDCVVYVGSSRPAPASAKHGRQAREGMPACDMAEPRPTPKPRPAAPVPAAMPASPAPGPPDTGSGLDAVGPIVQMKVDLWNLARSQQAWFATQGAYSWRTEPFAMQYLWNRGVKLRILSAGRDAWSAKATHEALPGKSCVIWYGPAADSPRTDGQGREAVRAAVPVCDEPS